MAQPAKPRLQRKCACGGTPGPTGECEACKRKRLSLQTKLTVNQPGDQYEQEVDRVAEAVMQGVAPTRGSISALGTGGAVQREEPAKPKTEEEKYKEAAKKVGEAFLETPPGKEITKKAEELGDAFISTLPGKIITGAAVAGAVATLAATHKELPIGIPEIPLDKIRPGLKMKITYEGPVDKPTKVVATFSIPLGSNKSREKKPAMTESEKFRAETARMATDQTKFREGLKTDAEKADEQGMMDTYLRSKMLRPDQLTPRASPLSFGVAGEQLGFKPGLRPAAGRSPLGPMVPDFKLTGEAPATEAATKEEPKKKEEEAVQRKATDDRDVSGAPPIVDEVLQSSGQPLDPATRAFMEPRFGYDFSDVRVHADSHAAESAAAVKAQAYTVGSRIVFDHARYAPETAEGRRLLAHELTHVIQQHEQTPPKGKIELGEPAGSAEVEADRATDEIATRFLIFPANRFHLPVRLRRAPETWYRGSAEGVAPASPGGHIHDFGDGLYLTDDEAVAARYAATRAGKAPSTARLTGATFERDLLGKVLDLTKDPRWQQYLDSEILPGRTVKSLIKLANENYWEIFQTFLRENNLKLADYDAIIGEEFVRGGNQLCIRNVSIADKVKALLKVVPTKVPGEGVSEPGKAPAESPAEGVTEPAEPGGKSSAGVETKVKTEFKVLSSVEEAGGNLKSEVEVLLKEGLTEVNEQVQAKGGKSLPERIVIRVTTDSKGAFVAAEGASGEPAALVEMLAQQAVRSAPQASGAVEGTAGAAASTAARVSPWVRGVGWAGLAIFVGVTAYQYNEATPEQKPRVLVSAGGALAGGAISGYVVCNLIFGIETVGWSLLGCLFVAGIPGGVAGSAAAEGAYDAATEERLSALEKEFQTLAGQPDNVRLLFQAMVDKSPGGLPIQEGFISKFVQTVPGDLSQDELSILKAQITSVGPKDTLRSVLHALGAAIARLPRRRGSDLPPAVSVTDILIREEPLNPFLIKTPGLGRVRILPPEPILSPGGAPGPEAAPTQPLLEVRF